MMDAGASTGESELIELARSGDVAAFGRLVEQNQDFVYNSVYHLVAGEQDAEDIAQEVFVKAYRNIGAFKGRARFSTWLYGIMLNTVRDFWRRRRRHVTLSLSGPADAERGANPDPP
ncbi:MAG: RNA polymerase sigma factor, partial [Planctomycetota bacterium]